MSTEAAGAGPVPGDHADRLRWNAKYAAGFVPSFEPHPLAVRVFGSSGSSPADLPDGSLAELACGPSGAALLAAAGGRRVTAVDVSEIALGMLAEEARRRGLDHLITGVHADLSAWRPEPRSYAVVLCTGFWASAVFTAAAEGVAAGGLLGWEAFTVQARRSRPSLPADWCWRPASPRLFSRRVSPCWTSRTEARNASCWPGATPGRPPGRRSRPVISVSGWQGRGQAGPVR